MRAAPELWPGASRGLVLTVPPSPGRLGQEHPLSHHGCCEKLPTPEWGRGEIGGGEVLSPRPSECAQGLPERATPLSPDVRAWGGHGAVTTGPCFSPDRGEGDAGTAPSTLPLSSEAHDEVYSLQLFS